MRALVTGASGFIGSTLVEQLGRLGFEVTALLRRTSSHKNLEGAKYLCAEGDLSDEASLRRAVKGMDYVFHLAGLTSARTRGEYFEFNTEGTARLARAAAAEAPALQRFVFVSSLAAAGPSEGMRPKTETDVDKPVSAYGESKLAAEQELAKYREAFPVSIVRPPIVYGPKDKDVFQIIQTVSRNFMPLLKGSTPDGNKFYSSIYVHDLVRGIIQAGLAPREKVPSGEVFFLSADEVHSYRDMLSSMAQHLNRDPLRVSVPRFAVVLAAGAASVASAVTRKKFPLNLDKLNELLPDYWICSNEKAKRVLGFAPEFNLNTGMGQAIEWYRQHKWIQ